MDILHIKDERRFVGIYEGFKCVLQYKIESDNTWSLIHTFVPEELRGKGLASLLVEYAAEEARKLNVKLKPVCSFTKIYFEKNYDKYKDLLK